MSRTLAASARVYRALLRAYPRDFRERYGGEMVETFRDHCRAALRQGGLAFVLVWPTALFSVARNGLAERISATRRAIATIDATHFGDGLRYDFAFAVRSLIRKPRFALFAIGLLALGMAGATGVFAVYHALLMAPPAGVHGSAELVGIRRLRNGEGSRQMSYPEFDYLRSNARSFNGLVAAGDGDVDLAVDGPATKAPVHVVSAEYFHVLQVHLQRGAGFSSERAQEAIISDRLWRSVFDGSPGALGRRILLNGNPFTIAGIAPAEFRGLEVRGEGPDLWVPVQAPGVMQVTWSPLTSRGDSWLVVLGRLAPGATAERAQQEVSTLMAQIARDFPESNRKVTAAVTPDIALSPTMRSNFRTVLTLLLVLIGLLQLMTCANLANLLLTRGLSLRTDVAVRAALGARPGRLIRQPLLEAIVLSGSAGLLGVLGSFWVATLAARLLRVNVSARPSLAVLGFAAALCALTALLSGAAPALRSARLQLGAVLRSGSASADRTSTRARALLLLVQVALATVLLVVSGAFVDSLRALQRIDLGFRTERLYAVELDLERRTLSNLSRGDLYNRFLERVRQLPGVEAATLTAVVPMSGHQRSGGFGIPGQVSDTPKEGEHNTVVPGYFATIGTPLVRGRDFNAGDVRGAAPVIVVNRALAEREWPKQDPIGKQILRDPKGPPFEIIGVVENARYYAVDEAALPMFFFPLEQRPESALSVLLRTRMDRVALFSALTREMNALEPGVTLAPLRSIDDYTEAQMSTVQASARLTSVIGVLAFVLAALGVFSVVSYNVAQRKREIAVRMALGASSSLILLLLARPGALLTMIGLAAGAFLARLGATRITAALNQMRPLQPRVLIVAVAVLGVSALVACLIPAARSLRVDVRRMLGPE